MSTNQWASRRSLAWVLRALIVLAPIAVSVVVVMLASRTIAKPQGIAGVVAWWVGILAVATLALRLTERLLRRFLPVIALLKLSLVFPDHAPSRFRMAIRAGTVRQLQKGYEAGTLADTPQSAAESLLMLSAQLSNHDRLTRGHSERVRAYSDLIAEELDLAREDRDLLHWAALLHDIGKLDVPAEILNKPGRPDKAEWEILKGHPGAAARHMEPLADWLGDWRHAATQHHERWEGGGYPEGLAGSEISLAGRIVAVADAFETITAARSYKEAGTPAEGRAEIARCAGTQFDPTVVKAFLNVSVGRLRGVAGPLSWMMNAPILAAVPTAAIPMVSTALVTTTAMTTMAMTGMASAPPDSSEQVILGAPTRIIELAFADIADPVDPDPAPLPDSAITGAARSPTPRRAFVEPTAQPLLLAGFPTPTPTSPPAGAPSVLYMLNPGSGDTQSSAVLQMGASAPTDSSLANYDTDRDNDPGLLIERGGSSVDDADAQEVQTWTYNIGQATISGPATFRIYAAPDEGSRGTVSATIDVCNPTLTTCTPATTVSKSFNMGSQTFKKVNIDFGMNATLTATQPVLRVRLWVPGSSDEDVWLAYDTGSYPTRLELPGG